MFAFMLEACNLEVYVKTYSALFPNSWASMIYCITTAVDTTTLTLQGHPAPSCTTAHYVKQGCYRRSVTGGHLQWE
jgi:hypothetical protein